MIGAHTRRILFITLAFILTGTGCGMLQQNPAEEAFKQGHRYAEQGEYEAAITEYSRAIEHNPAYVEAYQRRGEAYLTSEQNVAAALDDYTSAVRLDPYNPAVLVRQAELLNRIGDYAQARERCTQALEQETGLGAALRVRAAAYAGQGDPQSALADYQAAIDAAPDDAANYIARGRFYAQQGHDKDALVDYTTAIEVAPEDPETYSARAAFYRRRGQYKQALADYTRAVEIDPTYDNLDWIYIARGNVYAQQGIFPQAIEDYTRAIRVAPGYAWAYVLRGEMYARQGQHERAVEDYTLALERDSDLVAAYVSRGIAYQSLGEHDRARADFEHVVTLSDEPHDANSYLHRGIAYQELGQREAALSDFRRVLALSSDAASLVYQQAEQQIQRLERIAYPRSPASSVAPGAALHDTPAATTPLSAPVAMTTATVPMTQATPIALATPPALPATAIPTMDTLPTVASPPAAATISPAPPPPSEALSDSDLPVAVVTHGGNLRSEPRIVPQTVIAQVCPGDQVVVLDERDTATGGWLQIRVTLTVVDCVPDRVGVYTEGWLSATLLSEPTRP